MKEAKQINIMIGANIQKARVRARMTQEQLSELIGIGATSLSAVSLTTLRNICSALSVSSDSLLFGESHLNNDVQDLTDRLALLPPEKFELVSEVIAKLLAAFAMS